MVTSSEGPLFSLASGPPTLNPPLLLGTPNDNSPIQNAKPFALQTLLKVRFLCDVDDLVFPETTGQFLADNQLQLNKHVFGCGHTCQRLCNARRHCGPCVTLYILKKLVLEHHTHKFLYSEEQRLHGHPQEAYPINFGYLPKIVLKNSRMWHFSLLRLFSAIDPSKKWAHADTKQ